MPKGTVNGEPYEVPEGFRIATEAELRRGRAALQLLSDLDRSPHGRHHGDAEFQSSTGRSEGNPLLRPGQHIGYSLDGARHIVVPEDLDQFTDPHAWYVDAELRAEDEATDAA